MTMQTFALQLIACKNARGHYCMMWHLPKDMVVILIMNTGVNDGHDNNSIMLNIYNGSVRCVRQECEYSGSKNPQNQ